MKLVCSRAKQGKSTELLKRLLKETKSASFLSDELGLDYIIQRIENLKNDGENVCDLEGKEIKTGMNVNCNADYFAMIQGLNSQVLFLDLHIPYNFSKQFKVFV